MPRQAGPGGGQAGPVVDPVKLLKQYYPLLFLSLMIGSGLGLATHIVLSIVWPRYTASATFECLSPLDEVTTATRASEGRDEKERFMGTQVQVMSSQMVLDEAMKDPDMLKAEAWPKQFFEGGKFQPSQAARTLEEKIAPRALPQTNLIRLSMTTGRALDSKIIVDVVTKAYLKSVEDRGRSSSADQRRVLGQQLDRLKEIINEKRSQRDKILEEYKLEGTNPGELSQEDIMIMELQKEIVSLESSLSSVRDMISGYQEKLQANKVDEVPERIREEGKRDPVMVNYEQEIANLRDNEAALRKQGMGDRHSSIQAIGAALDAKIRLRDEYRDQLHSGLWHAELEQMRTALSSLSAQAGEMEKKRLELSVRRQDIGQALVRFRQIVDELQDLSEQLARYQVGYDELQIANAGNLDARVRVIATAQIPKEKSFPKIKVMLPLGAVLTTLLVGGIIFLREVLDQRVRGPADAAMVPRVKVLGIVPVASEDPARPASVETAFRDSPAGVITESFRQIRAPLVQKMEQGGHKTLLVLGGMPGSGATSVASNLAQACAAGGERVLIIDANLRRPAMHKAFKLADGRGLADVLAGAASLGDAVQETSVTGLHLLTAGTQSLRQPERLGGDAMARLLLEAGALFDRVFIDTAPAMVAGDGVAVANRCDAVMVVVRAYAEKRGLLARIRAQLADTRAEFLGVVVNAVRASAGGYMKRNIKATHQYQNGKA